MEKIQRENKIGEAEFINKNCWLAENVGYSPSNRCRYCELKFHDCLFYRYLVISLTLILFLLVASFLIEGKISKLVIISIFVLVIVYGYFFDRSTENIIKANFAEKKAKESFEELTNNLQQKVDEQTKEIKRALEVEKKGAEDIQRAYEIEKRALETEKKAHKLEAKANEGLRDLNEKKDQFMNATQHHLRTPLTAMRGFVDLAMEGNYGKISPQIKEMFHRFEISNKLLLDLINDFLDVSQIQLGKKIVMLKDNISLEPIFEEITREVNYVIETDPRFRAKGNKIYFKVHLPKEKLPFIQADPIKLKVALFNVFNNAVRYTEKGGVDVNITINPKSQIPMTNQTLNPNDPSFAKASTFAEASTFAKASADKSADKPEGKQNSKQTILIVVKDTGIRITKQEMPKLFSGIFERNSRSMRTNATGKGIGLYFTNNIIKEHNGAIWAESEGEGKGSIFYVELPIQEK